MFTVSLDYHCIIFNIQLNHFRIWDFKCQKESFQVWNRDKKYFWKKIFLPGVKRQNQVNCSGVKLKESFEAEFLKEKKKNIFHKIFLSGVKLIDFLDLV